MPTKKVVEGPWAGSGRFSKLPKKIEIGTPQHAFLSAQYVLRILMEAGVELPSVVMMPDGQGWFQIPQTVQNVKLSALDWGQIFSLIGTRSYFNIDHGKGETANARRAGTPEEDAPATEAPVTDPRVKILKNEDLTVHKGNPLIWREIGIPFDYQMRNFVRFQWAEKLMLNFDAPQPPNTSNISSDGGDNASDND